MANVNLPNFAALVNECLNYGFNDGPQVNRSRIKGWLNEAQARVARKVEAPEFQSTYALTTVAGTNTYSLPADFLRDQSVAFPDQNTRLRPIDLDQFDSMSVNASTDLQGTPAVYTLFQSSILLYPTPNAVWTLSLRYIALPANMINDSDVPVISPSYYDLLVTYAVMRAFEAEDDAEMAQYWSGKWKADLGWYATDMNDRVKDRPHQIDGTWAGTAYGMR